MTAIPDAIYRDAWTAALSAAQASAAAASQAAHRLEQAALAAGHATSDARPQDQVNSAAAPVNPTSMMFLRGAGVSGTVWAALKTACAQHGWAVVRDRRQAWHLARGRTPTVMIDFTDSLVTVGRVRAVYDEHNEPVLKRPAAVDLGRLDLETQAGVQMLVEAVVDSLFQPRARRA